MRGAFETVSSRVKAAAQKKTLGAWTPLLPLVLVEVRKLKHQLAGVIGEDEVYAVDTRLELIHVSFAPAELGVVALAALAAKVGSRL